MSNVSGIIKSIQGIMRKDVGVDGDVGRLHRDDPVLGPRRAVPRQGGAGRGEGSRGRALQGEGGSDAGDGGDVQLLEVEGEADLLLTNE